MRLLKVAPPSVLTCHCSVGVGLPVAEEVNEVLAPALMVALVGLTPTMGVALMVNVAAFVVAVVGEPAPKRVLLKTARYSWPFCDRVAPVRVRVSVVTPV